MEFVQFNLSDAEMARLLLLLGRASGNEIKATREPWAGLRQFLRQHCADDDVRSYLAELKRRKAAGEALVKNRLH